MLCQKQCVFLLLLVYKFFVFLAFHFVSDSKRVRREEEAMGENQEQGNSDLTRNSHPGLSSFLRCPLPSQLSCRILCIRAPAIFPGIWGVILVQTLGGAPAHSPWCSFQGLTGVSRRWGKSS